MHTCTKWKRNYYLLYPVFKTLNKIIKVLYSFFCFASQQAKVWFLCVWQSPTLWNRFIWVFPFLYCDYIVGLFLCVVAHCRFMCCYFLTVLSSCSYHEVHVYTRYLCDILLRILPCSNLLLEPVVWVFLLDNTLALNYVLDRLTRQKPAPRKHPINCASIHWKCQNWLHSSRDCGGQCDHGVQVQTSSTV